MDVQTTLLLPENDIFVGLNIIKEDLLISSL